MRWTPRLSIGHPEVDRQHRALIDGLQGVADAARARAGTAEIEARLLAFGDAVVVHFGEEERLMREYAYPGYAAHRAEHENLVRNYSRIHTDLFAAGLSAAMADALEKRLGRWLVEHVTGADREFGTWIRARRTARVG